MNQGNVLGSWDSGFLQGTGGSSSGGHGSGPVLTPDVIRGLLSELMRIEDPRGGYWNLDSDKGQGTGTPHDAHGHGSVGGLDDHGKSHHYDLWKPHH